MVPVLDCFPERKGHVEVMTVRSNISNHGKISHNILLIISKNHKGDYLPIVPTPKKPYPLQLNFINPLPEFVRLGKLMRFSRLPLLSYLKVGISYEIPIRALKEIVDGSSNQFMVRLKHRGGIRQLQHHVRGLKQPLPEHKQ